MTKFKQYNIFFFAYIFKIMLMRSYILQITFYFFYWLLIVLNFIRKLQYFINTIYMFSSLFNKCHYKICAIYTADAVISLIRSYKYSIICEMYVLYITVGPYQLWTSTYISFDWIFMIEQKTNLTQLCTIYRLKY